MAMAEGATFDVLAGEPDRNAVGKDRCHRQFFAGSPVNGALGGRRKHRLTPFAASFELAVDGEALRHTHQLIVDRLQRLDWHRGPGLLRSTAGWHLGYRWDVILFRFDRGV